MFKTYEEFKSNPDFRTLKEDIIKGKYNFYENKRLKNILMSKEKRYELKENQSRNNKTNINFGSITNTLANTADNLTSTAVKIEEQKLEKLKRKQIDELQSMIDNELRLQQIRERNERKLLKQREKMHQENLLIIERNNEKKLRRKQKEKEKELRFKEEKERQEAIIREKERKEKYLLEEEEKQRELDRINNIKKQEEQKMRDEKFRTMIDQMYQQQQFKLEEKQKNP